MAHTTGVRTVLLQKPPIPDQRITLVETNVSANPEVYPLPTIAEFYKGKCVLVTGATGFLGKVLVEKLLRSCPGIKELFLLLRPSKTQDVTNRLREYIENNVFKKLRDEQPDALNKIRALPGDMTLHNLGLADSHLQKVYADVSVIFNCAANVRFDDEARNTLSVNLLGVQNLLEVCSTCERLEALVHVSTAYSFSNQSIISEKSKRMRVNPVNMVDTTRWMTNDQLHTICMYAIEGRHSLYHLSKALSEVLIIESQYELPSIIVRPSIITASVKEPFPGWIDNYNGPSGFISLSGKGIVRTLLVDPTVNADWVPVDTVVNTLLIAAHYIAVKSKYLNPSMRLSSQNNVPIVNCTCPENNLITWMKVVNMCLPFLIKYPSMEVYRKPGGTVTSYRLLYSMCRLFSHYLPALLVDGITCLMLRKPRMISLYNRIHRVMSYLEYYTTHSFTFRSSNMRMLVEQLRPEDQETFPIDQSILDWPSYMENYVLGVRRYFSKEMDDTLPDARKRMMRVHCLWLVIKLSSFCGIYMLVRRFYPRAMNSLSLNRLLSSIASLQSKSLNLMAL